MSTVLMMFIIPIGLAFLFYERKDKPRYQAVFDTFISEVDANMKYTPKEKIEHVERMLLLNGYHVTKTPTSIEGTKKILSVGTLFLSAGVLYVGIFVYMLYFFYFKKPHKVTYTSQDKSDESTLKQSRK